MKLQWDKVGERLYETGIDRTVLFVMSGSEYQKGVAWNGMTGLDENPTGADPSPLYADNTKYLSLMSAEEFGGTISAYTYPEEFEACEGSVSISKGVNVGQQTHVPFGLSYRTMIGNDTEGQDHGYLIHFVYGATASPSSKSYRTVNDNPDAITFSWEFTTTPVEITKDVGGKKLKPTATMTVNSTRISEAALKKIEDAIYGTEDDEPKMLLPDDIIEIINSVDTVSAPVSGSPVMAVPTADEDTDKTKSKY